MSTTAERAMERRRQLVRLRRTDLRDCGTRLV
jgi:hypothetical protein